MYSMYDNAWNSSPSYTHVSSYNIWIRKDLQIGGAGNVGSRLQSHV